MLLRILSVAADVYNGTSLNSVRAIHSVFKAHPSAFTASSAQRAKGNRQLELVKEFAAFAGFDAKGAVSAVIRADAHSSRSDPRTHITIRYFDNLGRRLGHRVGDKVYFTVHAPVDKNYWAVLDVVVGDIDPEAPRYAAPLLID